MSSPRIVLQTRARELKTYVLDGRFLDDAGVQIPLAGLSSLTLTLFDDATKAILNTVSNVNILNTGRGAVDTAGKLTCTLLGADSPILNDTLAEELHVAFFQWAWSGGAKTGGKEVAFWVKNFVKLP